VQVDSSDETVVVEDIDAVLFLERSLFDTSFKHFLFDWLIYLSLKISKLDIQ
jgi:hypothetical protein